MTTFNRSTEQDHILGMYTQEEMNKTEETESESADKNTLQPIPEDSWPLEELHGEVLQFQTICSNCQSKCDNLIKISK